MSSNDAIRAAAAAEMDGHRPIPHTVSDAPFDPYSVERFTAEQERYFLASQWQMMWWRFLRHRLAVVSGAFLLVLYVAIIFVEFLAPYELHTRDTKHIYAPPQSIHLFDKGEFIGPFVYGYDYKLNTDTLKREYTPNPNKVQKLRFF